MNHPCFIFMTRGQNTRTDTLPQASQSRRQDSSSGVPLFCCGGSIGQWPTLKSPTPQVRRWQRGPDTRGNNPAAARTKVSRLERAIDALGDSESAKARWLGVALQEARRAAQERLLAVQVEECQASIERSRNQLIRLEQERVEIARGDGQSSFTRAHAASCIATATRSFNGRNSSVESTSRRVGGGKEELRKKRARSLSVPAPDLPGALSLSIVPLPGTDQS